MDPIMIVLRVFHILLGAFWAGTVFFLVSFLLPGVRKQGAAGRQFMVGLFSNTKVAMAMPMASVTTVLTGLILYWKDSNHMDPEWLMSKTGITFAVGGLAGIVALVIGGAVLKPIANRMVELGKEARGAPTAAQEAELVALHVRFGQAVRMAAMALTVALLSMACARYIFV